MNKSPSTQDRLSEAWRRNHPYLINLAYQMLGDVGAAEDVAQEAFLRLSHALGSGDIGDVRGWLTVVASRLCLDQARSARARHERVGDVGEQWASRRPGPAERVTLDDEIRSALLEVLRRLSPAERVAFVLHDVFAVPFDTIAETVGRPAGTCRQLARRARAKFVAAQPKLTEVSASEHQLVTERFITACANGDIDALIAVLDPAVWGVGTLLAEPAPPPQVNHGPRAVATNLLVYLGPGATLVSGPAGQPVVLAFANRRLFAAVVLTVIAGRITKIEALADPSARF
ncbi:RNA polymerase sigma factor SigI [Mycobacterium parmense]|uniref:Putative alternative RNA polymerase SigI n=1 Tax=Mycobacterium parmense TaxID=185642 RepID=A0A7I7YZM6_9MYCO|nr:RNA polymerase sigma factor SigI [Mycobacterium parmense]MCV7352759.1 RNA polymerase sigma factor SigI [Mycobacterium parmense]ORW54667.1 RNA polymerase subunit sigma [Mycobacterium parmense]BBZ46767.1 putative alternative RNA polymerase SigI [Mycobacterium parmense]